MSELTVRNVGTVVDQFTFEVHGEGRGWMSVEPPTLSLLPGTEGTVTLRAAPPRSPDIPAGIVPFGVRVVSSEDPDGSVVEEGTVEVGAYTDLAAELLPRTSRARRRTLHEIAFDNRGNRRINATLAAADPDELLAFRVDPPGFVAEPGTATFAKLAVEPRKRFWRGTPKTHPFQVFVQPDDDEPIALDGTLLQEAVLPRWLPKALLALLLLALALLAFWMLALRPIVENIAQERAEEAAEEVAAQQNEAIEQAQTDAAAARQIAEEAAEDGGDGGGPVSAELQEAVETATQDALRSEITARPDLGNPFGFRLARAVAPGATVSVTRDVPQGERWSLTDIVLQNPAADRGLMRIQQGNDEVFLEVRMENFRTDDHHFVTPVVFTEGQQVVLSIRCENEGSQDCTASAYFNGFTKQTAQPAEGEEPAGE